MTTARAAVLARIRAALVGAPAAPAVPRDHRTRGTMAPAERLARFAERVGDYRATVVTTDRAGLAAAVAARLPTTPGARIVIPSDLPTDWLAAAPVGLTVVTDDGAITPAELDRFDAVVTGAAVAIAETGTVVLDAGPAQGRRALSLVPDHHVCVVLADRIVETVPEAIAGLDATRPQTWISGPSATSDIELSRVEGVHGPRRLDVIVVAGP